MCETTTADNTDETLAATIVITDTPPLRGGDWSGSRTSVRVLCGRGWGAVDTRSTVATSPGGPASGATARRLRPAALANGPASPGAGAGLALRFAGRHRSADRR